MKSTFKWLIELLPGEWAVRILGELRRLRYPRLRQRHRAEQSVLEKLGRPHEVLSGPFKGMRYVSDAYFGGVVPKILGVYEAELADSIEKTCAAGPDAIIDIGAAEGYHAVGMAVRNPRAKTVCFEMYKPARSLIRKMARLNGVVDRVAIRGFCDRNSLRGSLAGTRRPVVICDCEGAEDQLMDPVAVEKLKSAIMIVELHDGYVPGVSARIRQRFESSHDLQVIRSRPRRRDGLPVKAELSPAELEAATDEGREEGEWFFLTPRR